MDEETLNKMTDVERLTFVAVALGEMSVSDRIQIMKAIAEQATQQYTDLVFKILGPEAAHIMSEAIKAVK